MKYNDFLGSIAPHLVQEGVDAALAEDLGIAGDITTNATIPADASATGVIAVRESGVIAGLPFAKAAIKKLDPNATFKTFAEDGCSVTAGSTIVALSGNGRALLTGERVALNYLTHMSGVATLTRKFVDAIEGTNASIACTRKTLPGLRAAQKYAVAAGGGSNHRFGLYDAILIKDNHIAMAGGIGAAITRVAANSGHMIKIEVEVDTLDQLKEVLDYSVDVVLLDNMNCDDLREAVKMASGQVLLEASGGVNLDTVRRIAETGVDLISVGALTHSAPSLDLGFDVTVMAS